MELGRETGPREFPSAGCSAEIGGNSGYHGECKFQGKNLEEVTGK